MTNSEKILKEYSFESDKTVATMTQLQLYKLIKFAVNRIKETD